MLKSDELKVKLNEAKAKAENLKTADEIKASIEEIKTIKAQIELAELDEQEEAQQIENKINGEKGADNMNNKKLGQIMAKAIVGKATIEELSEIKDLMVEGDKTKGGVTVPEDVSTRIIELQRKSFDMRKYVNVEPVGTNKGSRPIEANEPEASGFASVDEGADIQELHEPEFAELEYNARKYAGYIPLTNELKEDSAENILAYLEKWMAKNELNTYNYQIFNGTGVKSAQGIMTSTELTKEEVDFTSTTTALIKKLKSVINKDLEDIDSDNIVIFTNADGYQFIDELEDKNGIPYLQKDSTKASGYSFLGKEIVKVPSKFLANVVGEDTVTRTPFIIGDINLLYTLFDRKQMSIESTNIGGTAWRQDKTEVKGVFRFDGELVDKDAVKILLAKLQ